MSESEDANNIDVQMSDNNNVNSNNNNEDEDIDIEVDAELPTATSTTTTTPVDTPPQLPPHKHINTNLNLDDDDDMENQEEDEEEEVEVEQVAENEAEDDDDDYEDEEEEEEEEEGDDDDDDEEEEEDDEEKDGQATQQDGQDGQIDVQHDEDGEDQQLQQSLQQQKPREVFKMPEDYLIPIKLDVQNGIYKLSDSFLWNLNEESITPEQYAKNLCTEIDYPEWFDEMVASSIANQINSHREIMRKLDEMLPSLGSERLVPIFLDLTVNGLNLKDQFDWDLFSSNNAEAFARSLCLDLGLSREFENAISFAIREQIQFYFHQLTLNPTKFPIRAPVVTQQVIRNDFELPIWTPTVVRQGQIPYPYPSNMLPQQIRR